MFGFSADDAGIDSKELARWFIEGASCTVGDDDVFVYTDGTADVFADSTSVPVYNFVSAVDDAARSLAAGSRTPTKQQVAAATETAKEHASSEYAFIMFSLVKTDAGWVLDEDAFVSDTADHLFGLWEPCHEDSERGCYQKRGRSGWETRAFLPSCLSAAPAGACSPGEGSRTCPDCGSRDIETRVDPSRSVVVRRAC